MISWVSRRFPFAWRVCSYAWPHRVRMSGGVGLTVVGIALDLAKPLPLAVILDSIVSARPSPWPLSHWIHDWSPVAQISLAASAIVLITVCRGLVSLAANHLTIGFGQRMVNDLRIAIYAHVQSLSLRFHAQQRTGDLLFRVMADTFAIQGLVTNGALPLLSAAAMLLGMFLVMLWYDWLLAIVAVVVCPSLYLAVRVLTTRIRGQAVASKTAESAMYSRAEATIGAVKLVQAYGREDREIQDFRTGSERSLALSLRVYNTEALFVLVVESLLALGTAAIVGLGAMRILAGTLTIGELTVFLSYLRDLYQPIQNLSQNLAAIASFREGLERVFLVLDVEADVKDAPEAVTLPPTRGEIRFEHVSYAHEGGPVALRDINLRLAPGEHVALVGPTGAGKSTLAGLALRFFDPQTGRVTLDGHDLREITLASLRRQVTLMLQEPIVFHATAFENIAWGARDPSPARVREAARQTEAEAFILALPGGYDAILGEEGSTISDGQRQRLALARALVRDTPVVILDEPTSALDVATEHTVWQNVEERLRGHTVLVIAHRLSTASRADRIVVLEQGTITEQGTHDELLARRGTYFDLWHQADSASARDGNAGDRQKTRAERRHRTSRSARQPVKFLIVNADDFGYGHGVNRGIIELVDRRVVTSAGLMVNAPGTAEAVRLAAERPALAVGLHVNFTNESTPLFDFDDPEICRRELRRQFDNFRNLTGRLPTHIDSHQHVHRRPACRHSFLELAAEHGLPLRNQPPVTYKGGFYSQWVYKVPDRSRVSFDALAQILSTELSRGIYELAVHPGYHDPAADYAYHRDREWELEALGDPRLLGLLQELNVRLISYHQVDAVLAELRANGGLDLSSRRERLLE